MRYVLNMIKYLLAQVQELKFLWKQHILVEVNQFCHQPLFWVKLSFSRKKDGGRLGTVMLLQIDLFYDG